LNRYQAEARRTANLAVRELSLEQLRLLNWALGLSGEVGELVDHIKKHVFHGHPLDNVYVARELGDIGWYRANMATEIGVDLDMVDLHNIEKLRERYPGGFSQQDSINRKESQ
jgi:NTP pyrophosphatase (non-canonical NTP hydrolase)